MKNIYEKLNPDILASINADEQQYPYTTRALKLKLKTTDQWSDLSVNDIQTIINHSHFKLLEINYFDFMWGDKFLINEKK